jgi:hypothetical protein
MFCDSVAHVVLGSEFLHREGDSVLGDAHFKGGKLVPFLKLLKVLWHEMDIFLKEYNIILVLFVCAVMVFKIFEQLTVELFDFKLFTCLYKIITN